MRGVKQATNLEDQDHDKDQEQETVNHPDSWEGVMGENRAREP